MGCLGALELIGHLQALIMIEFCELVCVVHLTLRLKIWLRIAIKVMVLQIFPKNK